MKEEEKKKKQENENECFMFASRKESLGATI